jgi:hypothetical protein
LLNEKIWLVWCFAGPETIDTDYQRVEENFLNARVKKIFLDALISRVKSKLDLESTRRVGAFTESVDPGGFIVQNFPDYIFLCGGKKDDFDHALRAHFYDRIGRLEPNLFKKIQLAEIADDWYQSRKLYDDLLELEEYLAGLSAYILLFLESPGAIAELGVFSQSDGLRDKLIVIIEQSYYNQTSFIRNGPIERIRRARIKSLWIYPWLCEDDGQNPRRVDAAIKDTALDFVIDKLRVSLEEGPKACKFQHNDHGHRMLLITDLIKLIGVCSQSEIQTVLRGLGIVIKFRLLTKYLYLLGQLGLIYPRPFGNLTYFLARPENPEYIHYAPKEPNISVDRMKLQLRLSKDIPSSREKKGVFAAFAREIRRVVP